MIQKRKKEKYRAEELAKVVLKRLQDQVSVVLRRIASDRLLTDAGTPALL
jgi:hypothetical protein